MNRNAFERIPLCDIFNRDSLNQQMELAIISAPMAMQGLRWAISGAFKDGF